MADAAAINWTFFLYRHPEQHTAHDVAHFDTPRVIIFFFVFTPSFTKPDRQQLFRRIFAQNRGQYEKSTGTRV